MYIALHTGPGRGRTCCARELPGPIVTLSTSSDTGWRRQCSDRSSHHVRAASAVVGMLRTRAASPGHPREAAADYLLSNYPAFSGAGAASPATRTRASPSSLSASFLVLAASARASSSSTCVRGPRLEDGHLLGEPVEKLLGDDVADALGVRPAGNVDDDADGANQRSGASDASARGRLRRRP